MSGPVLCRVRSFLIWLIQAESQVLSLERYVVKLFKLMFSVALIAAVGCGGVDRPDLVEVTGTVTLNGSPAEGLMVTFFPVEAGRPAKGITDASGNYSLSFAFDAPGAAEGKYTVGMEWVGVEGADGNTTTNDKPLPKEYAEATKAVEVKDSGNVLDFALIAE